MFSAFISSLIVLPAAAEHWAVIAVGSKSYANYRHQADACHAYQLFRQKGVPEENIILMMYDDVANSRKNPFKGKLFNRPDPEGPGVDVYEGCNIDYRKGDVTPNNFIKVITGDNSTSKKVLKSTIDDEVFITFFDHGGVGNVAFPGLLPPGLGPTLHKKKLQEALQTMHGRQMYKKLVFYLESCESGSMFEDMDIPGVYAVSAASPSESSWGTYCESDAVVNGTNIKSCLGDLFSVNWMEDSDAKDLTKETLDEQFALVHELTNKSNVAQWGDVSFTHDHVSKYIGTDESVSHTDDSISKELRLASAVSAREVDLKRLIYLYSSAETPQERLETGKELQSELAQQMAAESIYLRFVELAYPADEHAQKAARSLRKKPDHPECETETHEAFANFCSDSFDVNSNFALQFHQIVVNICADVAEGLNLAISSAVEQACGASAQVL